MVLHWRRCIRVRRLALARSQIVLIDPGRHYVVVLRPFMSLFQNLVGRTATLHYEAGRFPGGFILLIEVEWVEYRRVPAIFSRLRV